MHCILLQHYLLLVTGLPSNSRTLQKENVSSVYSSVIWNLATKSHYSLPPFTYLQVIFLIDGQAVAENIACDNHIGFIAIYGDAVHAQELGQQCGTVTFHNILQEKTHTAIGNTLINKTNTQNKM